MTITEFSTEVTIVQPDLIPPSVPEPEAPPPVQLSAPYRCFECGAPADGLRFWDQPWHGLSPLDAVGGHIAYLKTNQCACRRRVVGCNRVAYLDGAITPLHFAGLELAWPERGAHNLAAVKAAVAYLESERDLANVAQALEIEGDLS